jgi:hypothetical protein
MKSLSGFYWQNGYGAFSVSSKELDTVIAYIANQHEQHRIENFQDEYRALLNRYDMEYDEKYIWD